MENLKLCNQKNFQYKFDNNIRKSYSPTILFIKIILALIFFYILLTLYYIINHITKIEIFLQDLKIGLLKKNISNKIISFEPSKLNFYILQKNYCLNEINSRKDIILINKGAYDKDIKCILYYNINNDGNGMIKCGDNNDVPASFMRTGEIELTILSHYIKYLEKLNLAFIKIDVEGSEGKALEGGIELLTRLHVPFIFLEFTPSLLKIHDTDPEILLQKFLDYGYKINIHNFLDRNYNTPDEIMKLCKYQINLYIVYERFLD